MPEVEGLSPEAAQEMVQAKLVAGLFSNTVRNEIVLKGGLAMRAAGSERYTKDIDLASPETVAAQRVRGAVRKAVQDLKFSGLLSDFAVSEPKQTDTTLRWKIGGTLGGTQVNLTVEVSRRPGLPMDHVRSVSWTPPRQYGLPPILLDCIDLEALAAHKVSCLGDPKREAPRDVFDLHLLITMQVTPPAELLRRLGRNTLQSYREVLWDKLEKMTFEEASEKLLPALPQATRSRIGPGEWDAMRVRVGDEVERWLSEAIEGDGSGAPEPPKGPKAP